MDELIRQALDYLRGMWHRRWIGLAVAWLVALAGGAAVMRMPDKYEASARVYVDSESVLKPLMSGLAVQLNFEQQIAMLGRTLISRPNVEKLVQMADLDLAVKSQAEREKLIDELMTTLQIKSYGRDSRENLYLISYRDAKPEQAKRVVQSLLSIFVESSLGDKRKDADTARRFIEEQIRVYEKRLEEAENRLKEFKLKNMGLTGADGRDYFTRMTALGEELAKARLELRAAEQSRDALKRELSGEDPVFLPDTNQPGASVAGAVPELDARIDALKKNLDELLRRYTDQHPDVVGTRRVIGELEEQRRQEIEARRKAAPAAEPGKMGPAARNPVFQQLKVALAESEATVAALRARTAEYEARYNALRNAARMLPQVEAEYAQLNRDYEVQKKNYEALVARRESAAMSGDLDATGVAEFRVIDPPRVAPKPVAPNRLLILPLVLAAALGAGALASFVASQIAPTFPSVRMLRAAIKRPVIGAVSLVPTPRQRRRRRRGLVAFAGGVVALVGVFASAMIVLSLRSGLA